MQGIRIGDLAEDLSPNEEGVFYYVDAQGRDRKVKFKNLIGDTETVTGAQDKADAAEESAIEAAILADQSKANLLGGNIFTGTQQNAGEVRSSAPLGANLEQLPNQLQVKQLIASDDILPASDHVFSGWTSGLISSRGYLSGDFTVAGSPTISQSENFGESLNFDDSTKYATLNNTSYSRIHQGLPFTLILEGESVLEYNTNKYRSILSNTLEPLWPAFPTGKVGMKLFLDSYSGGVFRLDVNDSLPILITNFNSIFTVNNPITKLVVTGSEVVTCKVKFFFANGVTYNHEGGTTPLGANSSPTSTNTLRLNNLAIAPTTNNNASKISRIRLFDRILDL